MSPSFKYVGSRGEHIVGIPEGDISEEEYDLLDYDHQQAVYLNRGSDGGVLYVEIHDDVAPAVDAEPQVVPEAGMPVSAPDPASLVIPDSSQPLDQPAHGGTD